MKNKTFYSNGKLLLTAEYLVLDGAKALALPTKFGQNLIVEETTGNAIEWTSFDADGTIWFQDNIKFQDILFENKIDNNNKIRNTLLKILHVAYTLNPDFITNFSGYKISTALTFQKSWGLGTSSTLLNNIAQWTNIDAFELLQKSFGGSGYDIFCAQNNTPIQYQLINEKPVVAQVDFNPSFSNCIYFVYLNKKQDSKKAINYYLKNKLETANYILKINEISDQILRSKTASEFEILLQQHENYLSEILNQKTVKELLFSDFEGTIKSLGAWGGDFVLVVCQVNPTDYFKNKGFEVCIPYKEMIL